MTYPPYPPPPQRVVHKRSANHGLHIFLTIITCGLWAITGWPIAAIMGRKHTTTYSPQAQYPPPGYQQPPPYGQQPPQQPPQAPPQ